MKSKFGSESPAHIQNDFAGTLANSSFRAHRICPKAIDLTEGPGSIELAHREHLKIIAAIRKHRPDDAEELARKHIRHALAMRLKLLRSPLRPDARHRLLIRSQSRGQNLRSSTREAGRVLKVRGWR